MTANVDLSHYVRRLEGGVSSFEFAVEGVHCGGCIARIERALSAIPQVESARLNFTTHRAAVTWRGEAVNPAEVVAAIERLGYGAHPFKAQAAEDEEARQSQWLMKCLAVAGFAAMNVMLLSVSVWSGNVSDIGQETRDFFHWLSALIALPAAAYAGQPFFISALKAIRARSLNMDVPISLGVLLALGMSVVETANHAEHAYFDSAVMLLFFLLCGRYLDHAVRRKTRAHAGNVAALRAELAHRIGADGVPTVVPAAALVPGDSVLVRPGERVPADGTVISGASDVDDGLVTGETALRHACAGDTVYAGTISSSGAMTIHVTAASGGTLLDEIERLLERASGARSRYVRLADRAARLYAPFVHTAAALTFLGWLLAGATVHDSLITAIAVLIITCPCALALAVPAVQVAASGSLFRASLLVNNGDVLERLAGVDTIVFDKTGTLTLPEPRVANAAVLPAELLVRAARLALSSHHPLSRAVARHANHAAPYADVTEEPGSGVRTLIEGYEARLGALRFCGADDAVASVDRTDADASLIAFTWRGECLLMEVRQALRPDAVEVVGALKRRGLAVHILSGDRAAVVASVADAVDIEDWSAGMKPAEKIGAIEAMKAAGHRVLMVGDGLNDAPSLAAATASIAPVQGSDLAQAQADAVFLGERLSPVLDAVEIASRSRRLMSENLILAIVYNALAVPLAAAGFVTPLIAAAAMSGSSMLVTLNALRVRLSRRHLAAEADAAAVSTEAPQPLQMVEQAP